MQVHLRGLYQAAALGERDELQRPRGTWTTTAGEAEMSDLVELIFLFFPRNRGSFRRVRRWPREKKRKTLGIGLLLGSRGSGVFERVTSCMYRYRHSKWEHVHAILHAGARCITTCTSTITLLVTGERE